MLRIYIGYDEREVIAFHTAMQSIIDKASGPVSIIPLKKNQLIEYNREPDILASNSFSLIRFMVPHLSAYEGISIYMDCDMILLDDIYKSIKFLSKEDAVAVVKHDYTPRHKTKNFGERQYSYPRKNWSSFIVWNCSHKKNKRLNMGAVNSETSQYLHRFQWLDDSDIASLPIGWNWLVGEYNINDIKKEELKVVHWTEGGPYINGYEETEYYGIYEEIKNKVNYCMRKDE
jgi:lipopolysaccharide biosynthesis glycosyltransferase